MSNPDPDLPPRLGRESRRHIGPLAGMALVVVFALGLMAWWLTGTALRAPSPDDGRSGGAGMSQEDMQAPPASPDEGGAAQDTGTTGTGTDAVGDPGPGTESGDAP